MKRIIIILIAILSTVHLYADRQNIKDRIDNWLQSNSSETGGGLRGGGWIDPGTEPGSPGGGVEAPEMPGPIGSGIAVLLMSGAGYALVKRKKK